mmetsp:Transcript_74763/g.231061  ORF Transcript_74763/g.231061 Transcript_74763/m.231061 type:complete len:156 (-) Transcript_74763:38-505(-)
MRDAADAVLAAHSGSSLTDSYEDSISRTGPGLLTEKVEGYLLRHGSSLGEMRSVGRGAASDAAAGLRVLGIDGFGCGQPHSGSRPCEEVGRSALVQHLFAGTWKRQLCWREAGAAFEAFAVAQGWHREVWYEEQLESAVRQSCGEHLGLQVRHAS